MTKSGNIIGIDVGGTFIKIGLVSPKGRILARKKIPTPDRADSRIIVDAIKEFRAVGIGIGVPGFVDTAKGIVHKLVNIKGWDNVPLQRLMEKVTGVPTRIDNDVNCMVLGEVTFGIAKGKKNVFGITLGTGVGGGIIIDGRIYRGASFTAGEVGHVTVIKDGPRCNCGNRGCLEALVGNKTIIKRGKMSPQELELAAKKGDKTAIRIWQEVGENVGLVLAGIVNVLNPELIVIGGGIANAGNLIMKSIRETVKKRAVPVARDIVKIEFSKLGDDAGILGAAALCMKEVRGENFS